MPAEIITKEDLLTFRQEIVQEFQKIVADHVEPPRKWLRSPEVRQMLNISPATLQNLRVNGSIPYSKIDSIFFYPQDEIMKLLEKNQRKQSS